jgi:hypothetical protein
MPYSPTSMPKFRYPLSAVLAVALVVVGSGLRVLWTVTHPPIDFVYSDAERHWFNATHPLETNPFAGIDPPAYELWLSLIARTTLGNRTALGIYAAMLSLAAPFVWFLFARTVLQRKVLALWFWAVLTWLPSWIGIFSYFFNETILIPLIGLSLWLTTRERPDTTGRWIGLNLSWILTCLTRIIALPVAAVAMAFALSGTRYLARRTLLAFAVWVCALTPFALRSYEILHVATPFGLPYPHHIYWESGARDIYLHITVPSRGTSFNYNFTAFSAFDEPFHPFSKYQARPSGQVDVFVNMDRGAADWQRAAADYSPTFSKRLHLYCENALLFLLADSWPDGHLNFVWENAAYHLHWMWLVIVLGAATGSAIYMYRNRSLQLVPCLAVVSFLVPLFSNAGVMEARFRKPLEGIFILALFWLAEQWRNSKTLHHGDAEPRRE